MTVWDDVFHIPLRNQPTWQALPLHDSGQRACVSLNVFVSSVFVFDARDVRGGLTARSTLAFVRSKGDDIMLSGGGGGRGGGTGGPPCKPVEFTHERRASGLCVHV